MDEAGSLREGVSGIDGADLRYADSLGYTVKLLATGIRREGAIELRVHPALLRHDHPLAKVGGAYNAVCLHGDSVGEVVLTGLGRGEHALRSFDREREFDRLAQHVRSHLDLDRVRAMLGRSDAV